MCQARGVRYSAIPIMLLSGIHDVYITEGTVNGDEFADFIEHCLLPILQPFNNVNLLSVVIMNNASIHHVERLIEVRSGAKLIYLPPYSPDLMPAEGVFSQVKSIRCYRLPRLINMPIMASRSMAYSSSDRRSDPRYIRYYAWLHNYGAASYNSTLPNCQAHCIIIKPHMLHYGTMHAHACRLAPIMN